MSPLIIGALLLIAGVVAAVVLLKKKQSTTGPSAKFPANFPTGQPADSAPPTTPPGIKSTDAQCAPVIDETFYEFSTTAVQGKDILASKSTEPFVLSPGVVDTAGAVQPLSKYNVGTNIQQSAKTEAKYGGTNCVPFPDPVYKISSTATADTSATVLVPSTAPVPTTTKLVQAPLVLNAPSSMFSYESATATVTGGSGVGAITFSVGANSECSVSSTGSIFARAGPGTCAVIATKAGDATYNEAVVQKNIIVLSSTFSSSGFA
jgi:hypothetical protein